MRFPNDLERAIKATEAWMDQQPGQKAGPSRLRDIRSQTEIALKAAGLAAAILRPMSETPDESVAWVVVCLSGAGACPWMIYPAEAIAKRHVQSDWPASEHYSVLGWLPLPPGTMGEK